MTLPTSGVLALPSLGGALDFLQAIRDLAHVIGLTSRQMQERDGLSATQETVLRIVGRFPDIAAGELAELLRVHPGALSAVVRRLENKGMLARRRDAVDKRKVLLGITAAGRQAMQAATTSFEVVLQEAMQSVPPEQLVTTADTLRHLAARIRESTACSALDPAPRSPADGGET